MRGSWTTRCTRAPTRAHGSARGRAGGGRRGAPRRRPCCSPGRPTRRRRSPRRTSVPRSRRGALVFETLHPLELRQARNMIRLHTWGDPRCCLPAGATRATLRGAAADLRLRKGDVLVFEEVLGLAEEEGLEIAAPRTGARRTRIPLTGRPCGCPRSRSARDRSRRSGRRPRGRVARGGRTAVPALPVGARERGRAAARERRARERRARRPRPCEPVARSSIPCRSGARTGRSSTVRA